MKTMLRAGIILAVISAWPATATTFSVGIHSGNCGAPFTVIDPVFATDTGTSTPSGAGSGAAGMIVSASAQGTTGAVDGTLSGAGLPPSQITQLASCETALMTLDDVVITGPGSTVVTSFSAHVVGSHSVSATADGFVFHATGVRVKNQSTSFYSFGGAVTDAVVTSPATTRTIGVPFSVSIQLDVEDVAQARGGTPISTATYNSSYSAGFPAGAPVFDLPAGFTANSSSGHIVDNFYQPPGAVGVQVLSSAGGGVRLEPATPNPMTSWTVLSFELPRDAGAKLDVYDVTGARVRGLVDGWKSEGLHTVRWDGRNDAGRPVGAGVYLYRLTVAGKGYTGKLVRYAP